MQDIEQQLKQKLLALENIIKAHGFKELGFVKLGQSFRCKIVGGEQYSVRNMKKALPAARKLLDLKIQKRGRWDPMLDGALAFVAGELPPPNTWVPRKMDEQEKLEQYFMGVKGSFFGDEIFDIPFTESAVKKMDKTIADVQKIIANPALDMRTVRFCFKDSFLDR